MRLLPAQVFGQSKLSKDGVPAALVATLSQFDLVLVQEIRDATSESPHRLLELMNAGLAAGAEYGLLLSERYGSSSSKEAYGWYYRTALVEPISHGAASPERFPERPPHRVRWRAWTGFELVTLGFHADPDNVEYELDQLGVVAKAAVAGDDGCGAGCAAAGPAPVLVLGDFNADCSYLGVNAWAGDASSARVVVLGQ